MKRIALLLILSCICASLSYSQDETKWKNVTHYVGTSINYTPPLKPYHFFKTFNSSANSSQLGNIGGNDVSSEIVNREIVYTMPSQVLGIAASYQIKYKSFYQEFSLVRLAMHESDFEVNYNWFDEDQFMLLRDGFTERSTFVSIRYEFGKSFQKSKKSKINFGLAFAFQPSFYHFKMSPRRTNKFGFEANIFTFEVAVIPTVSFKLSKKVFLDFKLIPNLHAGEVGTSKDLDPTIFAPDQIGEREFSRLDVSIGGSIQLRYLLKEPEKRGRR